MFGEGSFKKTASNRYKLEKRKEEEEEEKFSREICFDMVYLVFETEDHEKLQMIRNITWKYNVVLFIKVTFFKALYYEKKRDRDASYAEYEEHS